MSIYLPGRAFAQTVILPGPPDAVRHQLHMAAFGVRGYTVIDTGPSSMTLERRFIPTWALVLAGIGLFAILLGLLFLLVRETERTEIRFGPEAGSLGTRVGVSGVVDSEMLNRLQGVFLGGQPVFAAVGGYVSGPWLRPAVSMSADGRFWWDGLVWQDVQQMAPPAR